MKYIGIILIVLGFLLFVMLFLSRVKENNRLRTPIPDEDGIKVIFISPSK